MRPSRARKPRRETFRGNEGARKEPRLVRFQVELNALMKGELGPGLALPSMPLGAPVFSEERKSESGRS